MFIKGLIWKKKLFILTINKGINNWCKYSISTIDRDEVNLRHDLRNVRNCVNEKGYKDTPFMIEIEMKYSLFRFHKLLNGFVGDNSLSEVRQTDIWNNKDTVVHLYLFVSVHMYMYIEM